MDDLLVAIGGAVKALGEGRIGGPAVLFGSPTALDLDGEYFGPRTDFGLDFPVKINLYYHHGLDPALGKTRLGRALLERKDGGIYFKADLREEFDWFAGEKEKARKYRPLVLGLVQEGDMGSSTGSAKHVVVKAGPEILGWPLADLSLTPTPAHPGTAGVVRPYKSLVLPTLDELLGQKGEAFAAKAAFGELEAHPLLLASHAEAVVSAAEEYAQRLESRLQARVKAGRMLSGANISELEAVLSALDGVSAIRERVLALLEKAKPAAIESEDLAGQVTAAREKRAREQAARFEHIIAGLSGVPT